MRIKIGKVPDKDFQLSLYICTYLLLNSINSMLQTVFRLSGASLSIARLIIQGILVLELLIIINHLSLNKVKKFLFGLLIVLIAYVYSYIIGASLSDMQTWAFSTFTVCVPIAVCASLIDNKQVFYKLLLKFSIPISVVLLISVLGAKNSTYSMHFSYGILVMILLHFSEYDRTKKKTLLIISIVEFTFMLLFGSRGAIICVVFYLIIKIMDADEDIKIKLIRAVLLTVVAGLAYYFYNDFSSLILTALRKQGIYSRSINLLFSGNFVSHDSGRNALWAVVIDLIKEKPIWGWGIGGAMNRMPYNYPHQLFLDLFLTFGIPIGLFVGIIFTLQILKVFVLHKSIDKYLMMIFGSVSFVSLMFSGSVYSSYYFSIFLGLSFSLPKSWQGIEKNNATNDTEI